jgi:hypothetical protein
MQVGLLTMRVSATHLGPLSLLVACPSGEDKTQQGSVGSLA